MTTHPLHTITLDITMSELRRTRKRCRAPRARRFAVLTAAQQLVEIGYLWPSDYRRWEALWM